MLEIKVFNKEKEFHEFKGRWNSFLSSTRSDTIFMTWEWLAAWWDQFKKGKELLILAGYDGEKLVGIAPLMKSKVSAYGIKLDAVMFLGSGQETSPDHMDFIITEEYRKLFLDAVFKYLMSVKHSWDMLRFEDCVRDDDFIDGLPARIDDKIKYSVVSNPENICAFIKLPGTWEEYENSLSSKIRYNIRRNHKNLSKEYGTEFKMIDDPAEVDRVMRRLIEIHQMRMTEKNKTGQSMTSGFWEFHLRIAPELSAGGNLFLGVIKVDDTIIACQYAFSYNNVIYHYQSGLDTEFRKYGIGKILVYSMIEESIKRGFVKFDFLKGNEKYKFDFTDKYVNNMEVMVWNSKFKPLAAYMVSRLKKSVSAFVKGANSENG